MSTSSVRIHRILTDPTASHWLKRSLETAITRDCLDALNDAETLCSVLNQRFKEASSGVRS